MSNPNAIPLPIWAQTVLWAKWPTRVLDYYSARLPDPFTIRMVGNRAYVIASHPDTIKEIFTRFPDPGNEEVRPYLGSNSLFLIHGERHADHRRLIQPLLSPDATRLYAERIQAVTERVASKLVRGEVVRIDKLMSNIVIETITDVLFGSEDRTRAELLPLMFQMVDMMTGPTMLIDALQKDWGPLSPGRKIRNLLQGAEQAIRAQSAAGASAQSVLAGLLGPSRGVRLSEAEVVDEVKTLLGAGGDPTAAAAAWAVYYIHADKDVGDRVMQELGDNTARAFDPAAVGADDSSYLDLVLRETLRIMPAEPTVDRQMREPTEFMGHTLPTGTRVVACAYLTHRRPEIFENPTAFLPQRFETRKYSPFEYYPFGGGRRRCIGAYFATSQIKITLATLLNTVEFERPYKGPVGIDYRGVTLWPSRRLRMRVKKVRK